MPNEPFDRVPVDIADPRVRVAAPAITCVLALLLALIPTVTLTLAEDQSPRNKSGESDSFDVEPPVLKQNLSSDPSATTAPGDAVAQLEKSWSKQKEKQKAWNASARMGYFRKWKWSNGC